MWLIILNVLEEAIRVFTDLINSKYTRVLIVAAVEPCKAGHERNIVKLTKWHGRFQQDSIITISPTGTCVVKPTLGNAAIFSSYVDQRNVFSLLKLTKLLSVYGTTVRQNLWTSTLRRSNLPEWTHSSAHHKTRPKVVTAASSKVDWWHLWAADCIPDPTPEAPLKLSDQADLLGNCYARANCSEKTKFPKPAAESSIGCRWHPTPSASSWTRALCKNHTHTTELHVAVVSDAEDKTAYLPAR